MTSDLHSTQSQPPTSMAALNPGLLQRLQALIEDAPESWTYTIIWHSSYDYSGSSVLGWGDGYYKGEEDKTKAKIHTKSSSSAAEQEYRKKVLRELNSLISGSAPTTDDYVDEEVTDTEWFFLVSMTQSFVNPSDLPGQAFFNSSPVWVTGAEGLAASPYERARQGQEFGLRTIVCIPSANGVVELGSTEMIFHSSDLMNKVRVLFNFNSPDMGSWPMSTNTDQGENDPSLWLNEPFSNQQHQQQTQSFFNGELNFSEYAISGNSSKNGNSLLLKPESGEILNFGESKRSSCSGNVPVLGDAISCINELKSKVESLELEKEELQKQMCSMKKEVVNKGSATPSPDQEFTMSHNHASKPIEMDIDVKVDKACKYFEWFDPPPSIRERELTNVVMKRIENLEQELRLLNYGGKIMKYVLAIMMFILIIVLFL